MEELTKKDTLQTSLPINIWMHRSYFPGYLMVAAITVYLQFSFLQLLGLFLGTFLFMGIALFGFLGIYAHIIYYFRFEVNRKVELYTDRIVTYKNDQKVQEMSKNEVSRIILCDKLKEEGINLWPSNADSYYYLIIIGKNKEQIILTCLLDIKLKKKIALWYGQELEHQYQFFTFPRSPRSSK